MKYKYIGIITPPGYEDDGCYSAGVPQVQGVFAQGDDFDDAVANLQECLEEMLEFYLVTDGEFPPWKPVDDFEDYIELVEEGGDPWTRVELEVDWQEIRESLEQQNKAAHKIAKLFRSFLESRRVARNNDLLRNDQQEGDEPSV